MFTRTEYQLLTPPELGERCFLAWILHSLLGVGEHNKVAQPCTSDRCVKKYLTRSRTISSTTFLDPNFCKSIVLASSIVQRDS